MEYIIKTKEAGQRLDVFISKQDSKLSRAFAQKLIDKGRILVNDKPSHSSYKVKLDDKITIDIPPPEKYEVQPENIPLNIVYEDEDLLVVNKPRGLVTHPAPGHYKGTLVNALLYHVKGLAAVGGVERPGIVHRLDKDTSGLLLVAKTDLAHRSLSKQIKDRTVKRSYVALVYGVLKQDDGFVQEKIGRHPVHRKKMAVIKQAGLKSREALTFYRVLKRYKDHTLVELQLKTGRTHQIRVHMSHIGHPLVGDRTYGKIQGSFNIEGQLLHAQIIGFVHPRTGKYMEFFAPMPTEMEEVIRTLSKGQ
ncbi:RluA family pseudouridine synthase [Candidatus Saganbacteria bacterium]|nr:RluA family pseudouridine synthase [Candidatus Saganbacteria bacterium]